ncbi:DUF6159 family protein [Halomicroarcula sp. GCM10025709]|uniref:DUF6159 family protein n=1 Tax=Halomicroarcula sp. GCM10025709 TaxID=3252669 RepID=UPI00360E010D
MGGAPCYRCPGAHLRDAGTVLYILDEKFGFLGSVARLVFDLAWLLLTFFVVPVIIVEDTTDIRLILQQSGATFKQTWGESVTASLSVSLVTLPVVLVGVTCLASAYITLTGPTAWLLVVSACSLSSPESSRARCSGWLLALPSMNTRLKTTVWVRSNGAIRAKYSLRPRDGFSGTILIPSPPKQSWKLQSYRHPRLCPRVSTRPVRLALRQSVSSSSSSISTL